MKQTNDALVYAWAFLAVPVVTAIIVTVSENGSPPIGSMFTYWKNLLGNLLTFF